jgi:hypothetical protein
MGFELENSDVVYYASPVQGLGRIMRSALRKGWLIRAYENKAHAAVFLNDALSDYGCRSRFSPDLEQAIIQEEFKDAFFLRYCAEGARVRQGSIYVLPIAGFQRDLDNVTMFSSKSVKAIDEIRIDDVGSYVFGLTKEISPSLVLERSEEPLGSHKGQFLGVVRELAENSKLDMERNHPRQWFELQEKYYALTGKRI